MEFRENAKINGIKCTLLQVTHPYPRDYFDFHIAQIFIDDEKNVPIRYAAYRWPAQQVRSGQPAQRPDRSLYVPEFEVERGIRGCRF